MTVFSVTRTPKGLYLAMCHKCGYTGRHKTEPAAWASEQDHMCTETPE